MTEFYYKLGATSLNSVQLIDILLVERDLVFGLVGAV